MKEKEIIENEIQYHQELIRICKQIKKESPHLKDMSNHDIERYTIIIRALECYLEHLKGE